MSRAPVHYNDDASLLHDVEVGRAKESLLELIDRTIDNIPIDIYSIECAWPDMCEYETKVGEVLGRRFYDQGISIETNSERARGIEALRKEETDHLSVYIERLHQRNIKCVAEVRMNDTHGRTFNKNNYRCSLFALEHPEWVLPRNDELEELALDYSFPEVRKHRFEIMRELIFDYNTDGLELNFNRWGKHFPLNEGKEKANIMTEYMQQIFEMIQDAAKARGKGKLLFGIRIPSTLEECIDIGCDVETWVENDWLDYVVVAEYNATWPGTQVEQFVKFCKGKCKIFTQMGDMLDYQRRRMDDAKARGAAYNYYTWGTDGIGLWNICCHMGTRGNYATPESRKRMFSWINQVVDPDIVKVGSREYCYVPLYTKMENNSGSHRYREYLRSPIGGYRSTVLTFTQDSINKEQVFPFRIADGKEGESLEGTLRFKICHATLSAKIEVRINEHRVSESTLSRILSAPDEEEPGVWVSLDLKNAPPFRGENSLGITWYDSVTNPVARMEELIVSVDS